MPSDVARMATSDLTEIGRRLRDKLRELRELERRNQRGRGNRSRQARGQARLESIESSPADEMLLTTGEIAELLKSRTRRSGAGQPKKGCRPSALSGGTGATAGETSEPGSSTPK